VTDQELHKVFEDRLLKGGIQSHINYYSEGTEDRRQDGLLGVWKALRNDNSCTDRYLKNGAIFEIYKGSRTKSVDFKGKTAGKRKDLKIFSMDALEADAAASLLEDNKSTATDNLAIARISYQRFIESLNTDEEHLIMSKLLEERRDRLYKAWGQYKFMATYRSCREKFRTNFEC
jgi:hypothetical protein